MAPLLVGAAIAAPVLGGIVGNIMAGPDRERAQAAAQAALAEIEAIGAPPDLSKRIILEKFQKAGIYTPELEQQIDVGISKVSQIQEDPSLRNAQMGALQMLQQRAQTGLNPEDRAAYNEIRGQIAADAQGRLGAIQQARAARGAADDGFSLAAELSAAQNATNQQAAAGDRIAAQASQAALQAALNSGQLAGQMRGQDFDIANTKASAADQFKMFDTQNSIARQARNVASQNQGQMYNLSETQRIQDTNTAQENNERYRQANSKRQYWQDQLQRAGMRANAQMGRSDIYNNQADRTAGMWQGIGSGIGAGAGAGLNYASKQNNNSNGYNQQEEEDALAKIPNKSGGGFYR